MCFLVAFLVGSQVWYWSLDGKLTDHGGKSVVNEIFCRERKPYQKQCLYEGRSGAGFH